MDVGINNRFGVLLAEKSKQEKRNISLQEVEEAMGISRQVLYKWKNNSIERFEMRVLNALCKSFEIAPGALFEYVADPPAPKRKAPGRHEDMKLKDWYVVLVVVSLLATFGANELGLGWICFVPGLLVACWLMYEVIRSNKNPPT